MSARPAPVAFASGTTRGGVYYESHGAGPALFLGFPLMASHGAIFGAAAGEAREEFLRRFTDRYRVLLVDYPSIGGSATIAPDRLTLDRACADMLEVADAAGCERFAWCGGTFGAVLGLGLASSSSRVSALVCAGWPPLGAPYAGMVRAAAAQLHDPPPHARVVLREPAQYAQWCTFYGSVPDGWDREAVARIACPRAVVYGELAASSVGDLPLPLATTVRAPRAELERAGWQIVELPGRDAALILDPDALAPPVRAFLDSVLPISTSTQSNFQTRATS